MERNDKNYARHGMREGHPGFINPEDVNNINPAKAIRSTEHLDIKESGFGRDVSQQPADEHIEDFQQIKADDDLQTSAQNPSEDPNPS